MSVQTTYSWAVPFGMPGAIADNTEYAGVTFLNGEETGKLFCGLGVVQGETPGVDVKIPTSADTAKFEGVVINDYHYELDMDGKVRIPKGRPMAVLRWGKIYVALAKEAQPKYGDPLKMKATGEEAGYFDPSGDMAVNGRFLSGPDNGVALAEIFNPGFVQS